MLMNQIKLTNINLIKRQAISGETYFIIFDKNNENAAYFCFENKLKHDWKYLMDNWETLQAVEIEFEISEKGNKVLSLTEIF